MIRTPDRPPRSLIAIPTELFRLLISINTFKLVKPSFKTVGRRHCPWVWQCRGMSRRSGWMIGLTCYPRTWFLLQNIWSLSKAHGTSKQNNLQLVVMSLSSLKPTRGFHELFYPQCLTASRVQTGGAQHPLQTLLLPYVRGLLFSTFAIFIFIIQG